MPSLDLANRHPSVQEAARWLEPNTNLPPHLRVISEIFFDAARDLLALVEDSPQLTLALHKMVGAKDCAVRARLAMDDQSAG